MQTFRELRVWQKSKALALYTYKISTSFPKEELFGLTSQMRRSSVSIPSNIAEGFGRRSNFDYARFLRIASGSLYELQTQIEIAYDLGYTNEEEFGQFLSDSDEIAKMLSVLIRKVTESTTNH